MKVLYKNRLYEIFWEKPQFSVLLYNEEEDKRSVMPFLLNVNQFKRMIRKGELIPQGKLPRALRPTLAWRIWDFLYERLSGGIFSLARKLEKKKLRTLARIIFKVGHKVLILGLKFSIKTAGVK